MTATITDLKAYVGATDTDYDSLLEACLAEAQALVARYVGAVVVPEVVLDRAHIEVAADLFNRRNAPNGIVNQQYATADGGAGAVIRITRDPMQAAYKILGRWVTPW